MIKRKRVVITGLGLVTPLGVGVHRVWERLLKGSSGIISLPEEEKYSAISSRVVGIIPRGTNEGEFNEESIVSPSERRTMSLSCVYALCATREALTDSKWTPVSNEDRKTTGVSVGTCVPDADTFTQAMDAIREGKTNRITPYLIPKLLTNLISGHISMRYGLRGPNHSISTACATGLHSIGDASAMIARGE